MLKDNDMQLSIYSILYNKIPENHILKLLKDTLDFSFINDILRKTYSDRYGRPAKEPEMMVKLLLLQNLYNLSDVRVIEEATLNLAYMYFLGINPEDELPHPSLLSKFRRNKLGSKEDEEGEEKEYITLDEIMAEFIRQCVDEGIIKGTGITIDTTHTEANTFKCTAERVMKRLSKKLLNTVEKENGEIPKEINPEIPDYKEIEDHKEAKATMKTYLEETIHKVEETVDLDHNPNTKEVIDNAKEILSDPKFIEQKGVRSIVDQDARVGHKSKTSSFFGFKTEYMMTTEERIITAVNVNNGAYVDGQEFDKLLDLTMKSGITVEEVFGDKAYFRKPILDRIQDIGAKPYIPVSEMAYRINEDLYSYNKDSDEWFCIQGNKTEKKVYKKYKNGREVFKYYFDIETCRNCPLREACIPKGTAVRKILTIGINTPEFYGYSQEQKTEEFKEKYKERACQEWKNGEMKNFHGLDRAKGYDHLSMELQAKLTAFAVNLKRIGAILSSNKDSYSDFIIIFIKMTEKNDTFQKMCA